MRLDQFNNPIFNETDIFDALYVGHQESLSNIMADTSSEISKFCELSEIKFANLDQSTYELSVEEYDKLLQKEWFMPANYYNFDVEQYCISKCTNSEEQTRVLDELAEYNNRGMIPLLQWIKYFVDTCIANNIVWGVGRGSSVSSFVLYLIGAHRIHSIKYNLDWQDFLR